jgi:tRNA threonylcarbamoyl adenosine modification protein YjeE
MADASNAVDLAVALADEAATIRLAEDLATILRTGDVIRLEGDLGAGKTTFARALLRAIADDAMLEVPSPTFTLVQSYEFPRLAIAHFDLYRLGGVDELDEIGFDEAIRSGAALIEWAERAEDAIPLDALTLRLDPGPDHGARRARLSGPASWSTRLRRTLGIRAFLTVHGWGDAGRRHVKSDASARSIERVALAGETRILMNHPPETDDDAGHARRAARAGAKLAEDSKAFVAIARGLRDRGFSAPRIDAHDGARGLILMEDFGSAFIAENGQPIADRYAVAVDVLADLHALDLPRRLPDGEGGVYALPEYSLADLLVQLEPFLDWAVPHLLGQAATQEERSSFLDAWRPCLVEILAHPKTWALRDYHSPNLMWLPDRTGAARVGLLDFQDAVLLHPAYDLASVAQDARVTIAPDLEASLLAHYIERRQGAGATFDRSAFESAYAILAAQRATRILGIFARLANRDGRPEYLVHYPRMIAYLRRTLEAPALAGVRAWMERHVDVALDAFR